MLKRLVRVSKQGRMLKKQKKLEYKLMMVTSKVISKNIVGIRYTYTDQ